MRAVNRRGKHFPAETLFLICLIWDCKLFQTLFPAILIQSDSIVPSSIWYHLRHTQNDFRSLEYHEQERIKVTVYPMYIIDYLIVFN